MAMAHGMNVFSLLAMHARGVCSLHHALGLLTECMAIDYQPPMVEAADSHAYALWHHDHRNYTVKRHRNYTGLICVIHKFSRTVM